jgi:Flp pilus assembly protein TadD
MKQGRSNDAMRECEAALRLNPDLYPAHAQLGLALATAGRLDEALGHLRRATELKPGEIPTWRLLATTCAQAGRFAEAVQAIERALALENTARANPEATRDARLLELYRRGQASPATP